MKSSFFKSITLASLGLAVLFSCTKNEVGGPESEDSQMKLSVTGVLGEYKAAESTKASLVNTPRVGWSGNETVYVFQQSDGKYLGPLTSSVKATGASVATLGGTISSGTGTLVFVYTNATMPSLTAGTTYTSLEISLAEQGADIPFVVYGTAESPGTTTVSGLVVNFSFATSVVSTYAAGLPSGKSVTKAILDNINTKCVLSLPSSGAIDVGGNTYGPITKTDGISSTNAQGQVLFEMAVPVSNAVDPARSIEFTIDSEIYTAGFSGVAIAAGMAYSAMSENHSVEGVLLNRTSTTIFTGATETLTATVYPSDATNKAVTWTSSNTAVATVDANGTVTGIKAGTATITATTTDGGKTATCTVTVKTPVAKVSLNKSSTTIFLGTSETLTATVYPTDATNKTLTWESSNTEVATVNENGVVTVVALGTATITATSQDTPSVKANCTVMVDSHEYVVIGGLKWATCNIGADKPTAHGWYFSWGNTDGYIRVNSNWVKASDNTTPLGTDGKFSSTNYESTSGFSLAGNISPKSVNDAARVNWGGDWRMPAKVDFKNLHDSCGGTSTPQSGGSTSTTAKGVYWCTDYDGKAGLLFCDGAGHKLFFPATGKGDDSSLLDSEYGYYWSSSLPTTTDNPDYANNLLFGYNRVETQITSPRNYGYPVRPVSD